MRSRSSSPATAPPRRRSHRLAWRCIHSSSIATTTRRWGWEDELSKRYPEPTTAQEAQALQKFLKDGARTQLRTIETVPATVPSGTVTFATPVTIKFERTLEQLVRALAANAERRIRLRIELVDFQGATEGGAALFLNNPSASAQTPE